MRSDSPRFQPGPRERPLPFSKAGRNETPQKQGRRREKDLAKDLGGRQQPGSGCFDGKGGDVFTAEFLVESKVTRALSYSLSLQTLRKLKLEAFEQRKKPALVLELTGQMMFEQEKWAIVPYEIFKQLLEER